MYKGKFLIANPVITDPIFENTIVYLVSHNPKGAEGIIVNPKSSVGDVSFVEIGRLFKEISEADVHNKEMLERILKTVKDMPRVPLFPAGPVRTEGPYLLHGYKDIFDMEVPPGQEEEIPEFDLGIPNSFGDNDEVADFKEKLTLMDGVYFGTPSTFANIIDAGKVAEGKFRFYIGTSSWSAGQLEHEIAGGAWRIIDANPELFFDKEKADSLVGPKKKEDQRPWADRHKPSLN